MQKKFAEVATEKCKLVNIIFISSEELRGQAEFLQMRWEDALPITSLQKKHTFQPESARELIVGRYAKDNLKIKVRVSRKELVSPESDAETEIDDSHRSVVVQYHVGEWVLVKYDQQVFPGEIMVIEEEEVKVSVMVRSGSGFQWPTPSDCLFYSLTNVIKKLEPPNLQSASFRSSPFMFKEKW